MEARLARNRWQLGACLGSNSVVDENLLLLALELFMNFDLTLVIIASCGVGILFWVIFSLQ